MGPGKEVSPYKAESVPGENGFGVTIPNFSVTSEETLSCGDLKIISHQKTMVIT